MKLCAIVLGTSAALGFAVGGVISLLIDRNTFVLSVDGDKLCDALDRRFKSASLRELYEDNKISCDREGGLKICK